MHLEGYTRVVARQDDDTLEGEFGQMQQLMLKALDGEETMCSADDYRAHMLVINRELDTRDGCTVKAA
jgi:hypothetical protein